MIVGNDISKYQGDIVWDTYRNNSNFVIIKATEGNGLTDSKLGRNQSEARRVNMPLGYYHFAHPELGNYAIAEADYFLGNIGPLVSGEVYCLDYEANWNGDVVGWCRTFMEHIKEKTGVKCFIYLNQSLIRNYDWSSVIAGGYQLWIAAYTGSPTNTNYFLGQWPSAAMHQWTNAENVPGISGSVDGDSYVGTVDDFKKCGYIVPIPPPPTTPPETIPPNCDEAVAQAILVNNQNWQSQLDSANQEIKVLKSGLAENLDVKTLFSILLKKILK